MACKTPFLHSLTIEWICICRAGDYWCPVQCKYVHTFCVKRFELSHVMDTALQKCYVLLLLSNLKTREAHVQFDHRSSLALSSSPDCWATSWRRARLSVGGVSPVGDRRCSSESSRVLASWAAASRWRGHLLTVRSTALLLLSGCVVGDEGLVLLVCLTFVCLVV